MRSKLGKGTHRSKLRRQAEERLSARRQSTGRPAAAADLPRLSDEILLEGEAPLAAAIDAAELGSYEFQNDPEFEFYDQRTRSLLGIPEALSHSGRSFWIEHLHPDDRERVLALSRQIMEGRLKSITVEYRYQHPQRGVVWLNHASRVVEGATRGRTVRVIGVMRDITEQKKTEAELRNSTKKYQALIETMSDFIWETDVLGRYTYCSPQMERLWGIKPEQMIGKTPFDVMPPEDRNSAIESFAGVIKSPRPFRGMESVGYDGHGRLVYLEISGIPFFDDDGKLLGFRGISRDITERKRAEEALRESELRFRTLIDSALAGTYLIQEGRLQYVNRAQQRCLDMNLMN